MGLLSAASWRSALNRIRPALDVICPTTETRIFMVLLGIDLFVSRAVECLGSGPWIAPSQTTVCRQQASWFPTLQLINGCRPRPCPEAPRAKPKREVAPAARYDRSSLLSPRPALAGKGVLSKGRTLTRYRKA